MVVPGPPRSTRRMREDEEVSAPRRQPWAAAGHAVGHVVLAVPLALLFSFLWVGLALSLLVVGLWLAPGDRRGGRRPVPHPRALAQSMLGRPVPVAVPVRTPGWGGPPARRWAGTAVLWRLMAWMCFALTVGLVLSTLAVLAPLAAGALVVVGLVLVSVDPGQYARRASRRLAARRGRRRPLVAVRRRRRAAALPDRGGRPGPRPGDPAGAAGRRPDDVPRRVGGSLGVGAPPDRARPARRRPGPPRRPRHEPRPGLGPDGAATPRPPDSSSTRRAGRPARRSATCGRSSAASTRRCSPTEGWSGRCRRSPSTWACR